LALMRLAYFVEGGTTVTEDDVAKSAHALEIMQRRGLGDLADRMGIQLKELSADRAVCNNASSR